MRQALWHGQNQSPHPHKPRLGYPQEQTILCRESAAVVCALMLRAERNNGVWGTRSSEGSADALEELPEHWFVSKKSGVGACKN